MHHHCRFCNAEVKETVTDLGLSPISNHFWSDDELCQGQPFFPLKVLVCDTCWLVQLQDVKTPPHFHKDYAYFSSYSRSWLEHAQTYATKMMSMLGLHDRSLVVELASNDGYLLQYFKRADIPVLGVEPSANVAETAQRKHGINCRVDFF